MTNNKRYNIIERMRRERERRWILKMLQKRTLETGVKARTILLTGEPHYHLKFDPLGRYHGEKGFIYWVAQHSLSSIRWMDFKGWWYKLKLKLKINQQEKERFYEEVFIEKIDLYNSLIKECVSDFGYVLQKEKEDGLDYIRVSPRGDTFVSQFWYKCTIGHPIGTAIIIGIILTSVTAFSSLIVAKVFKPKTQENQIHQIQILPYDNIIK